jgi:hypothetical protein
LLGKVVLAKMLPFAGHLRKHRLEEFVHPFGVKMQLHFMTALLDQATTSAKGAWPKRPANRGSTKQTA